MDSCPKELAPFEKAHKKKIFEQDMLMYNWWGSYGLSAVSVAVEHCLAGQKAKSKYLEKAIFSDMAYEMELTQEEIDNRELQKMLLAEELWAINDRKRGLPETITK